MFEQLKKYDDGKLWNFLNEIHPHHREFEIPELPPPSLYHYTDVHGLNGIIESNSLRASAAYYLNDSSEVEYGCRVLVEELERWVELNKGQDTFAAKVVNTLHRVFMLPLSKLSRSSNIYVSCFCEQDNLLSQWRAYGQKGGYSLGFDVDGLSTGLEGPGPYNPLRLVKVIYDRALQLERIQSVLEQAIVRVGEAFEAKPVTDAELNEFFTDITMAIQELLLDEIVAFKHPAFLDEREWRLVARLDLRSETPLTGPSSKPIHQFRVAGGYVLPFVELKPMKGKIPLTSIRFGPSLDFDRYQNPLYILLARNGFTNVQLNGSGLPVIL
jgi:hypothetical protein